MGEDNKTTEMVAYIDGNPITVPAELPEATLAQLVEISPAQAASVAAASLELKTDPEAVARLLLAATDAWRAILLAFEPVAAAFKEWLQSIGAAVGAEEELETALRWATMDNRPLYNRYRHTKKQRIRKKYAKRILAWYREEVLPRG